MNEMYQLAPSVYAADYLHLQQQMAVMKRAGIRQLHIDIMDGIFVPNLSFGPDFVAALREDTEFFLDVHLMIEEPLRFVRAFSEAGADGITVHWEACGNMGRTLEAVRSLGRQAGIALNPGTPVETLVGRAVDPKIWELADRLQLMTVAPGLKGQTFLNESAGRIAQARHLLRKIGREIPIEVDGDITPANLGRVLEAGAGIIVAGKGLFSGSLERNIGAYRTIMERKMKQRTAETAV